MKNIILVDYNQSDKKLYSKLAELEKYNLTTVNNYDSFINTYDNKKFDLCLVNIEDKKEHDFVVYYMSHQKNNQKILSCVNTSKNCFFNQNCMLCQKYEIKTLSTNSDIEYLESCIDNYNEHNCEFYKG